MNYRIVNKATLHLLREEVGTLRGQLLDAQLEVNYLKTLLDEVTVIVKTYNRSEETENEYANHLMYCDRLALGVAEQSSVEPST